MISLRGYQLSAVQRIRDAIRAGKRSILLVAPCGCHTKGQGILMFDGSIKSVEHVQVGELLMGPDSMPRAVQRLCRGFGAMYRIIPVKGSSFVVNNEHVLTLVSSETGKVVDVTVKKYLCWGKWAKFIHKLFRSPVEFSERQLLPVEPYFLGLLLGDGCLKYGVAISKPDEFVQQEVQRQANMHGLRMRSDDSNGTRCVTHYLTVGRTNKKNPLKEKLRSMGIMGCTAGDKFIPMPYKIASRNDRLELLAGLLDTDGYMAKGGYDFLSKSKRLADDTAFVARSLGFAAYVRECQKFCQNGSGGTYYRLYLSGDCSHIPTRRKQASVRRQIKDVLRTGFKVEPVGTGSYYGFTLDGDGRYLLDDFTVTHNSGKTVIGAHILHSAYQRDRKSLFIAHRRELIHQASNKLKAFGLEHGILMSDEPMSALAETQVASIQTFVSRVVKRNKISAPAADIVMVDESHRATANSYLHLKEIYPDAIFIGLTATPCRTDGRGLGKFFDCLIEVATPQELIDLGYLVDTKIVAPRLPDLRGLRTVRGDYEEAELEKRMKPMIGDLVEDWKHFASNRSTLVFAVTVAHSVWIKERFENSGINCEHVDAQTPLEKRDRIFDDFQNGKLQIITNVGICTEGTDLPIASCALMARPTKSYGLYLQCVGRIARPHPSKTNGALIIDHSGAVYAHGFPQDSGGWELDEKFSMTEKNQTRLEKESSPITCIECWTVYTKQLHCPNCGCLPGKKAKALSMEEGRLYHIQRQKKQKVETFTVEQKADWYGQLLALELAGGKKNGWAAHKYREKFSCWPNLPAIRYAPHKTPTPEVKSFVQSRNIAFARSREKQSLQR